MIFPKNVRLPARFVPAIAVAWLLGAAACSTAPSPAAPAVVRVENRSDRAWRISFQPVADAAAPEWLPVAPRETRSVSLPAGAYRVRRELLGDDASATSEARELSFESGADYAWPLGTLFSSGGGAP